MISVISNRKKIIQNDAPIVKICSFVVSGKHECDSETGFCPDKCPFSNGSYPYWRVRNAVDVPFLWVVAGMKFYDTASSTKPLTKDPKKGYASSYFGHGKCNIPQEGLNAAFRLPLRYVLDIHIMSGVPLSIENNPTDRCLLL